MTAGTGTRLWRGPGSPGEGGHFIDTLSWWLGADPVEISAVAGRDPADLQVTCRFDDGSLGTITYLTDGHSRVPKETFDVSGGRRSARLDNFRTAAVWAGRRRKVKRAYGSPDKGQRAAIDAFLESVRTGGPMPIPLRSLLATTRATLAVSAEPGLRGRGAGVNAQRLGWYAQRLGRMSPSEVGWRIVDGARHQSWRRHQVSPGSLSGRPACPRARASERRFPVAPRI